MDNGPHDWMTAAACAEGPRPRVTFADLPQQHQEELVRLGCVAAASTAYFIVLAVLSNPLPSRSLARGAVLPDAVPAVTAALAVPVAPAAVEARLAPALAQVASPRPHAARRRAAVTLVAVREPADDLPAVSSPSRRNPVSRFFRGVLRMSPD